MTTLNSQVYADLNSIILLLGEAEGMVEDTKSKTHVLKAFNKVDKLIMMITKRLTPVDRERLTNGSSIVARSKAGIAIAALTVLIDCVETEGEAQLIREAIDDLSLV